MRTYKDGGEKRLANVMATMMARAVPLDWPIDAITFVPASRDAVRRRGFDHGLLLAEEIATLLKRPVAKTLRNPTTADQRQLTQRERVENLSGSFAIKEGAADIAKLATRLLLIDDVYTTGSTLCAASEALLETGFEEIRCATFTRVY